MTITQHSSQDSFTDEEISKLLHFKHAEHLAHIVPYETKLDNPPQKSVLMAGTPTNINDNPINIVDEDGVQRLYNVHKIKTDNAGLVGFVLYSDDPDNPRVHVLFRGTHNRASARRDIETLGSGPGSYTFERNKGEILRSIKKVVRHKQQHSTKAVVLSVAGHSLGGADAQMCATAILEDIAVHDEHNPLAKLGKLNIMHANAAGVTHATAKKAKQSLNTIRERNLKLKISQHIIHVAGDAVQQGGYTSILSKASSQDVDTSFVYAEVEPKYYKLANKILLFIGNIFPPAGLKHTYTAHTSVLFHGKSEHIDIKFNAYNNQNPEDALFIRARLEYKTLRRAYKNLHPVKVYNRLVNAVSELPKAFNFDSRSFNSFVDQCKNFLPMVHDIAKKSKLDGLSKFLHDAIKLVALVSKLSANHSDKPNHSLPNFNKVIDMISKSFEKNVMPYMEKVIPYLQNMPKDKKNNYQFKQNFDVAIKLSQSVFDTCKELHKHGAMLTHNERMYAAMGVMLSVVGTALQVVSTVSPVAIIPRQIALRLNSLGCSLLRKATARLKANHKAPSLHQALARQEQQISSIEKLWGLKHKIMQVFGLRKTPSKELEHKHAIVAKNKHIDKPPIIL